MRDRQRPTERQRQRQTDRQTESEKRILKRQVKKRDREGGDRDRQVVRNTERGRGDFKKANEKYNILVFFFFFFFFFWGGGGESSFLHIQTGLDLIMIF